MGAKLAEIQVNAPSFNTNSLRIQLKGTVTPNTNTTAAPRPTAVLTFGNGKKRAHSQKVRENHVVNENRSNT